MGVHTKMCSKSILLFFRLIILLNILCCVLASINILGKEQEREIFEAPKTSGHTDGSLSKSKRSITVLAELIFAALAGAGATTMVDMMLSTYKGVDSNQCKYSITHKGEYKLVGKNEFQLEWETEDGDVNKGSELLGWSQTGPHTDTGHERIASAAYLKSIRFFAEGNPCVTAIAISCGDQAYKGGGSLFIDFQDFQKAFEIDGNKGNNEINLSELPKCVRFGGLIFTDKIRDFEINADIFKCDNKRDCIQRNIKLLREWW